MIYVSVTSLCRPHILCYHIIMLVSNEVFHISRNSESRQTHAENIIEGSLENKKTKNSTFQFGTNRVYAHSHTGTQSVVYVSF
jgi:hypothetical protein